MLKSCAPERLLYSRRLVVGAATVVCLAGIAAGGRGQAPPPDSGAAGAGARKPRRLGPASGAGLQALGFRLWALGSGL